MPALTEKAKKKNLKKQKQAKRILLNQAVSRWPGFAKDAAVIKESIKLS